jgi:hypothetical protein
VLVAALIAPAKIRQQHEHVEIGAHRRASSRIGARYIASAPSKYAATEAICQPVASSQVKYGVVSRSMPRTSPNVRTRATSRPSTLSSP